MLRILVVLFLLAILVSPVGADKTIIQKTVTLTEVDNFQIRPDDTGNLVAHVGYHVLDNSSARIGLNRSIVIALTTTQQNAIKNFITNNVIPAINAQEGT